MTNRFAWDARPEGWTRKRQARCSDCLKFEAPPRGEWGVCMQFLEEGKEIWWVSENDTWCRDDGVFEERDGHERDE